MWTQFACRGLPDVPGTSSSSPPTIWRQRSPFSPGRRGNRSTVARSASRASTASTLVKVGEAVHALGPSLELAGRLRAAEHQHRRAPRPPPSSSRGPRRRAGGTSPPCCRPRSPPASSASPRAASARHGPRARRSRRPGRARSTGCRRAAARSSVSGYWSGVVRCFSSRQPSTRISTASGSIKPPTCPPAFAHSLR